MLKTLTGMHLINKNINLNVFLFSLYCCYINPLFCNKCMYGIMWSTRHISSVRVVCNNSTTIKGRQEDHKQHDSGCQCNPLIPQHTDWIDLTNIPIKTISLVKPPLESTIRVLMDWTSRCMQQETWYNGSNHRTLHHWTRSFLPLKTFLELHIVGF